MKMKKYKSRSNTLVLPALISAVFFLIFGLIICPLNYKGNTPVIKKSPKPFTKTLVTMKIKVRVPKLITIHIGYQMNYALRKKT